MDQDYLKKTGREALNEGLAEIEQFAGSEMPVGFDFDFILGDVIMCEYNDCSPDGTEIVRDGIWLNLNMTKNAWRTAKVLMVGTEVSDSIKVGCTVLFPNDKGIKTVHISNDGSKRNIVFLNQERIFGGKTPKDNNGV